MFIVAYYLASYKINCVETQKLARFFEQIFNNKYFSTFYQHSLVPYKITMLKHRN